jgi:hypothetical protein
MRDGETVGMSVLDGLAIGQKHIMVRAISGNVMEREMPASGNLAAHSHSFPICERARDFYFLRHFRFPFRHLPAEDFTKDLFSLNFMCHVCFVYKWTVRPFNLMTAGILTVKVIPRSDRNQEFSQNCNAGRDFELRGQLFCPAHGRRNQ